MQIAIIGKNYSAKRLSELLRCNLEDIIFINSDFYGLGFHEIEEFVNANAITLLIDTNYGLINNNFASFNAPFFLSSASSAKKFAYKNKIQTSKFATFDKISTSGEYLQNLHLPMIIKPDYYNPKEPPFIAETKEKMQKHIEHLIECDNKRILLEEYINGIEYTKYVALDGYSVLNIFDAISYFDEISTNNTNYVSKEAIQEIETNIIPNILDAFMEDETLFIGIMGISFIIDFNKQIYFSKFKPFFADIDIEIAAQIFDNDFKKLLLSCAEGTLLKNYPNYKKTDKYIISGEIKTSENKTRIISQKANTMPQAIKLAEFEGISTNLIDEAVKFWKN